MHVVIASKQDTAYIDDNERDNDPTPCAMDYAEALIELAQCDMEEIGWRKRKVYIVNTDNFRLRLKAWATPMGNRTIVLRVSRKRDNGSLGMERLVYKRVNGKII